MGSSFSRSGSCQHYKKKIYDLQKEINEFKSGRILPPNAGDPYNEYNGGKKNHYSKRVKKTRKTRKRGK